jgi:signal transduction histidine kinase/ligand-binding sensor domain-containing protein/DNA-binding response OmpR family regulator
MKKALFTTFFLFFFTPLIFSQAHREAMLNTISYLFTVNGGLSSTKITCITQEDKGFFWIGTEDGLNRFDGYNFTIYKKQYADSMSLVSNHITALFQDSRGRIWVGTMEGLAYYDPSYDCFVNVSLHQPDRVVKQSRCSDIMEDRKGRLWFAASGTGALRYSPDTGESVVFAPSPDSSVPSLCSAYIHSMAEDGDGNIWFGSQDNGISVYSPATDTFRNFHTLNSHLPGNTVLDMLLLRSGDMLVVTLEGGVALYDTEKEEFTACADLFHASGIRTVCCAVEDEEGNILVGTEGRGVFVFDPAKGELGRYPILEEFAGELDGAKISSLYIGRHNYVWIGLMYKGVFVAGHEWSGFRALKKIYNNPNSLNCNYATAIAADKDNDIWIATDGGGLNRYRASTRRFTHYTFRPDDSRSLCDNAVLSVFCDSRNRIWTGVRAGGLSLFDRKTETFTRFEALGHLRIRSIREDRDGFLWLGSNAGLIRFDPESKSFLAFRSAECGGLPDDNITALWIDSRNRIWVGTHSGICYADIAAGPIAAFTRDSVLNSRSVYSIGESSDGTVWAGTADGLNRYDSVHRRFSPVVLGSPDRMCAVNGIVSDGDRLWLSTNQGLVRYSIPQGQIRRYTQSNSGLGSHEFLQGSYYKSPGGEIFFGGANGLETFYPAEIQDSATAQTVYITRLSISNEAVSINKKVNGRVVLTRNISETDKITLCHTDRNFTLEFVAMGSYKPYSTVYACKLEGFDKEWIAYDYTRRSVTYTNLNPGVYTFRVKAGSNPEEPGGEETSLIIEIKPAIWNTWWARLTYALLTLGLIYAVQRSILIRIREKNELNIERIKVKQQEELNNVRTSFFTNISHEFRTPLTLIIGPLKRFITDDENEERRKSGLLILRNAEKLQHLINQILDLNKIEEGKMTLHVQPVELVAFVNNFINMFTELMSIKRISLTCSLPPDKIEIWYDPDMLDKCLSNLLYNAYKFTPDGGKVHVEVRETEEKKILLTVQDTGIGMNREMQEHLFDRFFQGDKNNNMTGTGIGMHLTKTIVELHKGSITVESEEKKGSGFHITILPGNAHFTSAELAEAEAVIPSPKTEEDGGDESGNEPLPPAPRPSPGEQIAAPSLLLVEDSSDMRFYIRQELSGRYHIEEAVNGKEGLDKALRLLPDLIIADVMMPEMDGIELCRILKSTPETSHIPIIMLTALDDMKRRLESMESGADSFITKPFHTKYLQVRIEKLIELRRNMKERFSKSIYLDVQELSPLTSMDERLLQKAIDYVRTNIENPELSVEQMSRELGMSRTHLHRKLKALTGQSPVEFIKMIRMKQAANLLNTGKLSVSEVGYKVGYNTLSYFSSSFSAHFGMSPTAYMEKAVAGSRDREKDS